MVIIMIFGLVWFGFVLFGLVWFGVWVLCTVGSLSDRGYFNCAMVVHAMIVYALIVHIWLSVIYVHYQCIFDCQLVMCTSSAYLYVS